MVSKLRVLHNLRSYFFSHSTQFSLSSQKSGSFCFQSHPSPSIHRIGNALQIAIYNLLWSINGNNNPDCELHIMTLLQYHYLGNIVNGTEPNPKATSIVSSLPSTKATIDSWLGKDGCAHAFMLFNMKPQVAHQFLGKDDGITKDVYV